MHASPLFVPPAAQVAFRLTLATLGFGIAVAAETPPSPAATPAPKTHTLFMGADLSVEKDKAYYPVEEVTASSLVIKPAGKPVKVPIDQNANVLIKESLKLAVASVEIDDLRSERAYTPGRDPYLQLNRVAGLSAGVHMDSDILRGDMLRASSAALGAGNEVAMAASGPPESRAAAAQSMGRAQGMQAGAEAALIQSYQGGLNQIFDVGSQASDAATEAARELYDAIRLSFEVSTDKDLVQPFYAVIAQIRLPDAKPGQVRKWAYVKMLAPMVAGETRKIYVYTGGLPLGYQLDSCEVHIYNHNEELATNLSRKRVPLTDAEALDFRVIEYVGANKGHTLPAALFPTRMRDSITPAQRDGTYYVRVGRDGRVSAAFHDATGKQPLEDAEFESVLQKLRFKPALEAGKPVETIVPINLGQLPAT